MFLRGLAVYKDDIKCFHLEFTCEMNGTTAVERVPRTSNLI